MGQGVPLVVSESVEGCRCLVLTFFFDAISFLNSASRSEWPSSVHSFSLERFSYESRLLDSPKTLNKLGQQRSRQPPYRSSCSFFFCCWSSSECSCSEESSFSTSASWKRAKRQWSRACEGLSTILPIFLFDRKCVWAGFQANGAAPAAPFP